MLGLDICASTITSGNIFLTMKNRLPSLNVFWFRRDLRLEDNKGLSVALSMGLPVLPIFIFDTSILDQLPKDDQRLTFIHQQLQRINQTLTTRESRLVTNYGSVIEVFEKLILEFEIKCVICNHDYEPYAKKRDEQVAKWLDGHGIEFKSYKDQVIFEKDEILKDDGKPYTVFTPYMKKWKSHFDTDLLHSHPSDSHQGFAKIPPKPILTLESMGFEFNEPMLPTLSLPSPDMLEGYEENRDYPAKKATSRLSVHLRFGTISIRELVRLAVTHSESWWNELIWREFYMMILWHFPHVAERSFKPAYDLIPWRNDTESFDRWCQGTTGYPLVDAGMRQLNETGFMHNRLRMVTASFLTKHLLIHWQWARHISQRSCWISNCRPTMGAGSGPPDLAVTLLLILECLIRSFKPKNLIPRPNI